MRHRRGFWRYGSGEKPIVYPLKAFCISEFYFAITLTAEGISKMVSRVFKVVDWFVPQRGRNSKAALGRGRMFVISHILGPASATSIIVFLHLADPDPGWRVDVIEFGIISFWALPFLMKVTGSLEWAARLSVRDADRRSRSTAVISTAA